MNKKAQISLILLITVVLMLAMIIPAQARDNNFLASYDLPNVDPDHFSATGDYDILLDGVLWGDGVLTMSWIPRSGAKQGTMIFEDYDAPSSMVARTIVTYEGFANGCANGHFQILVQHNEGDYNLAGAGTLWMCGEDIDGDDVFDHIWGELSGWAAETN